MWTPSSSPQIFKNLILKSMSCGEFSLAREWSERQNTFLNTTCERCRKTCPSYTYTGFKRNNIRNIGKDSTNTLKACKNQVNAPKTCSFKSNKSLCSEKNIFWIVLSELEKLSPLSFEWIHPTGTGPICTKYKGKIPPVSTLLRETAMHGQSYLW